MKNIIIFDLDGTLADISHRLPLIQGKTKRWDDFFAACVDDFPIKSGIATLTAFKNAGYKIIIYTGRSDKVRMATEVWLREHVGFVPVMAMRKDGDYRSDHELKREWLNAMEDKDRVLVAFEDRYRVVNMYRDEGITCYQVDHGDF